MFRFLKSLVLSLCILWGGKEKKERKVPPAPASGRWDLSTTPLPRGWAVFAQRDQGRLRRAGTRASPVLGLLPVIPDQSWGGLAAVPKGCWSPRIWHPLIRGWGGRGAAGHFPWPWVAVGREPRARPQAQPCLMGSHGCTLAVVSVRGPKVW